MISAQVGAATLADHPAAVPETAARREDRASATVGTSQIALVDTCPLWFDELHLVGANGRAIEAFEGRRLHTYEVAFELMARGRLAVDGLVTHRFPLERYKEAFATLGDRGRSGAIKVAFAGPGRGQ